MIYKFSVIRTLDSIDITLYVSGSLPELGQWKTDKSVELRRSGDFHQYEPSFWYADVELSNYQKPFDYKFLSKNSRGMFEWEGCGERQNRKCDQSAENIEDGIYYLPPVHWIESDGRPTNERQHTTNFYCRVIADHQGIHFDKINDRIYLGSCPRQFFHVATLKSLGITAVLTLQTSSDMLQNCRCVTGVDSQHDETKIVEKISKVYQNHGIAFVWLPTPDMSTEGRIRSIPQGVFLLHALIQNGHRIYVYCNAGVGRSVAIVCAYFLYVKGMKFHQMQYFLCSKRPAIYIDAEALQVAKADYDKKFGVVSKVIASADPIESNGLHDLD